MTSLALLEKCCFLADSVAGNPTHYMIEQAFEQAQLDWRFMSFEVEREQLALALQGVEVLGFRGVKLSGAFRTAAAELLGKLTPRARRAGSANCLMLQEGQLVGDDTYGAAFVEAVETVAPLAESRLLVIGTGRAARSIVGAAGTAGAATIYLADEQEQRLAEITDEMTVQGETVAIESLLIENRTVQVPEGVRTIVYAPTGGAKVVRPLIDADGVGQQVVLVDTRLRGSRTNLLRFAAEQGAVVIEGVDLAARETALTLELWTGRTFERTPLRELAEEYLGI